MADQRPIPKRGGGRPLPPNTMVRYASFPELRPCCGQGLFILAGGRSSVRGEPFGYAQAGLVEPWVGWNIGPSNGSGRTDFEKALCLVAAK